jgi:hypothetical protein
MPTVALRHEQHTGRTIGNGHCVAYVREVTGLPPTLWWRRGDPVRDLPPAPGTAIATFDARGRYANATDGSSHAAIYLFEAPDGIRVLDQWVEHPVSERLIRYRGGVGKPCDDASRYYVIELADDGDG